MANNTLLNAGTGGDTIQTEDNAGVKTQVVKPAFGTAGTVTLVSTTNPMPVGDAGGSLTVDNAGTFAVQAAATLAAETTKVIGTVNIAAAQTLATVTTVGAVTAITNALPAGTNAIGKLSANGGVTIGDVNVISQIPGTGATNLGKAEDAVHADGDTGVMALAVRRDANTSLVSATGDYAPLQVDATGNLKVAIISGAGSGGTALADNATFTRGTTSTTPFAGIVETSAPTLTSGNTGTASLTTGGAIRVDVTSGGIPGFAEDAASAGGEQGVLSMGVRQDTLASNTSTDGDYTYNKFNSVGALYASVSHLGANAILTGNGVTGTGSARVTIASDNTAFSVNAQGTAAQDAAIAGNPVPLGMRASTATPTAMSADGDIVYPWATRVGATVISGDNVDDAAFTPGTSRVVVIGGQADETATDSVDEGDAGALRITLDRKLIASVYAHPAGGYTPVSTVSAASTNATVNKASPGTLGSVTVSSVNAAVRYLKFYNKATAPTVGTDTPVYVLPIPGNTAGAGITHNFGEAGLNFSTGIAWALTTGATVADTGAVSANEHVVSIASI